jgi:CBS domain-containing protein
MTAGELMTRRFEIVQANASLEEVARKLESYESDPLPVCKDGLLVGLISRREIAARVAPMRRRPLPMRVADIITPDILFCFEGTEVTEAASLMKENRVSLLPVLSRGMEVVGVLALKDIPGAVENGV